MSGKNSPVWSGMESPTCLAFVVAVFTAVGAWYTELISLIDEGPLVRQCDDCLLGET